MVLAIGLPDLAQEVLPGAAPEAADGQPAAEPPARESMPVYMKLDIASVVDNLLLTVYGNTLTGREVHARPEGRVYVH